MNGPENDRNQFESILEWNDIPEIMQRMGEFDTAQSDYLTACANLAHNYDTAAQTTAKNSRNAMIIRFRETVGFLINDTTEPEERISTISNLMVSSDAVRQKYLSELTDDAGIIYLNDRLIEHEALMSGLMNGLILKAEDDGNELADIITKYFNDGTGQDLRVFLEKVTPK